MRNIHDGFLNLAVLISLENSSGSGFLYRSEKFAYLITAKHVLFDRSGKLYKDEFEITCQTNDLQDDSVWRYRLNLKKLKAIAHTKSDVTIVPLFRVSSVTNNKEKGHTTSSLDNLPGLETLESGQFNLVTSTLSNISKLSEVLISNEVYVFGYPTSLGLKSSPQFDYSKPLLRRGVVANFYKNSHTIILDCPVYGGNSGGPVVQLIHGVQKKYRLIGVVSQYVPYVQKWTNNRDNLEHMEYLNSGYSIASCFDIVIELVESFESK